MARETYDLIQFKRGKLRDWLDINPILAYGEPGLVVSDAMEILGLKIGNGILAFKDLPYAGNPDGGGGDGGFDPDLYYTKEEIDAMFEAAKAGFGEEITGLQSQISQNGQNIAQNSTAIEGLQKDKANLITTYENAATVITDLEGQGYVVGDSITIDGVPGIVTAVGERGEITNIWLENSAAAASDDTLRVDGGTGSGASVTVTSVEKQYGIEESEDYMTMLVRMYALQKLSNGPVDGKFRAVRNGALEELYHSVTQVFVDPTYSGTSNGTEFAPYKSIADALNSFSRPTAEGIIYLTEGNYGDVDLTGVSNKLLIGKAVLGERRVFLASLTVGAGSENIGIRDLEISGTTTITGSGQYTFENVKFDGATTVTKGTSRFSGVTSGSNLEFTNGNILYENCELSGVTSTIGTGALLEVRNSRIGQVIVNSGGSYLHYSGCVQGQNGLPAIQANMGASSVLLLNGSAVDRNGNLLPISIAARTSYMLGAFLFNSEGSTVPAETFRKTDGILAEQIRVGLSSIGYSVTSPFLNEHLKAIGNKILDVQAEGYNIPIVITPDDPLDTKEYTITTGGNYTEGRVLYGLSVSISGKINSAVLGVYEDGYTKWTLPAENASYFALSSVNQLAGAQIQLDESIKAVGSPITGITSAQAAVQIQEAIEKHNMDPSAHTFLLNLINALSGIASEKQDKIAGVTGTPKLMTPPATTGGQPGTVEQSEFMQSPPAATAAGAQVLTAPTVKGAAPGLKPVSDFATSGQGAKADTAIQNVVFAGTQLPVDSDKKASITQQAARQALGLKDAAYKDSSDFATAAQGKKADTAVQPAGMASAIEEATSPIESDVREIQKKIPSAASEENQLADKAFVNSSIVNMAARFITPTADGSVRWSSLNALKAGPWYYGAQAITCTENDYAIYLQEDQSQWRASYQNGEWVTQYKVNDAPFTSVQEKAINSGITKEIVDTIVPNTRKVNGKTLSADITLNTDDIPEGTENKYFTEERVGEILKGKDYSDFGAQPAMNAGDPSTELLVPPTEEGAQPGTIPQSTFLKTVKAPTPSVLVAPDGESSTPTTKPISDFATAEQGGKADTAVQPAALNQAIEAVNQTINNTKEALETEIGKKANQEDLNETLEGYMQKTAASTEGNVLVTDGSKGAKPSSTKLSELAKTVDVGHVLNVSLAGNSFSPASISAASNTNVTITPSGTQSATKFLLPTTFTLNQALLSCFNLSLSGQNQAIVEQIWLSSAAWNNQVIYNSNFWVKFNGQIGTAKIYNSKIRISETGAAAATLTVVNSEVEITRNENASNKITFNNCKNSTIHLHGYIAAKFAGECDGVTIYLHDSASITEFVDYNKANTIYICPDSTATAPIATTIVNMNAFVVDLKRGWYEISGPSPLGKQHDIAAALNVSRRPSAHTDSTGSYGIGTSSHYGHLKLSNGLTPDSTTNTAGVAAKASDVTGLLKPKIIFLADNSSQWITNGSDGYKYIINAATHGKGLTPQVRTFSFVPNLTNQAGETTGLWEETYDSPQINVTDGTVTVYSNRKTPAFRVEIRV